MKENLSDVLGMAVKDYYYYKSAETLWVCSEGFDNDELPVEYLFREFNEMPTVEQTAMKLSQGKVLDVGACAGSHSLYLQQKGLDVTALEYSGLCVDVMRQRGIKKVIHEDFYQHKYQTYDTILLLMNGTGIAKNLFNFPGFLKQLKKLLNPNGQVLIDSSDLIYLFENEEGGYDIPLNGNYYGEMDYAFQYGDKQGEWFPWLYLDEDRMKELAELQGFVAEIVERGEHYDYLAKLTLNIN